MTMPLSRAALDRMKEIARAGGGTGNVMAEFNWDLPRVKRVCEAYQIEMKEGHNPRILPPPRSDAPDTIEIKVPMSRPVLARLIRESDLIGIPPGVLADRILRAVFESGDLTPIDNLRLLACMASYSPVASMRQTETLKSEE